jgi:hypothetical protein
VLGHVEQPGDRALERDEPGFVTPVPVEHLAAEPLADLLAQERRQHLGAADREADPEGRASPVASHAREPRQHARVPEHDVGAGPAQVIEDGGYCRPFSRAWPR